MPVRAGHAHLRSLLRMGARLDFSLLSVFHLRYAASSEAAKMTLFNFLTNALPSILCP